MARTRVAGLFSHSPRQLIGPTTFTELPNPRSNATTRVSHRRSPRPIHLNAIRNLVRGQPPWKPFDRAALMFKRRLSALPHSPMAAASDHSVARQLTGAPAKETLALDAGESPGGSTTDIDCENASSGTRELSVGHGLSRRYYLVLAMGHETGDNPNIRWWNMSAATSVHSGSSASPSRCSLMFGLRSHRGHTAPSSTSSGSYSHPCWSGIRVLNPRE